MNTDNSNFNLRVDPTTIGREIETDYNDGEIVIIDDMKEFPQGNPMQIDMVIILICTGGRAQVDINSRTFSARENDMVVFPPNVYIENYLISRDFSCKIIGLSYPALQRMLHVNKDIWEMLLGLSADPVFPIDDETRQVLLAYYSLLSPRLRKGVHPYRKEVLHSLLHAVFYELCAFVKSHRPVASHTGNMTRGDQLMTRFLKLLHDVQGCQRSVNWFAEKLCVSPKYLSSVCRSSTGRSAKAWIHESAVEVIIRQLKYSDRSIKEIAELLGFPNLAVFGKFVRSALGVSPTDYRAACGNP